jgi:hypothetical protein
MPEIFYHRAGGIEGGQAKQCWASQAVAPGETGALDKAHATGFAVFSVASSYHTTQNVVEIRVITTSIRATPLNKSRIS